MRRLTIAMLLFAIISMLLPAVTTSEAQPSKSEVTGYQATGDIIAKKISATEALGPLASVALSPFFGIACLSGASIISSSDIAPKALANNPFLINNKALNNPLVFVVFLLLSIGTTVPRLTTVSKAFSEATDQIETYAGIISYLAIFMLAGQAQSVQASANPVVYTAGIFTFTWDTLLMIAMVINIIVINTVKYFFELLVWISPIPSLDAMFELANKVVATALSAIYMFSPALAFTINIVIFLICLTIFSWARRRVKRMRAMLIDPIIAKLLGRKTYTTPLHVRTRISHILPNSNPFVKVFPARKIGKIKKRDLCYLTAVGNNLSMVKPRLIRKSVVEKLETGSAEFEIRTGLISNSIEMTTPAMKKTLTLSFSKVYNNQLEDVASRLRKFGKVTMAEHQAQTDIAPQPA